MSNNRVDLNSAILSLANTSQILIRFETGLWTCAWLNKITIQQVTVLQHLSQGGAFIANIIIWNIKLGKGLTLVTLCPTFEMMSCLYVDGRIWIVEWLRNFGPLCNDVSHCSFIIFPVSWKYDTISGCLSRHFCPNEILLSVFR